MWRRKLVLCISYKHINEARKHKSIKEVTVQFSMIFQIRLKKTPSIFESYTLQILQNLEFSYMQNSYCDHRNFDSVKLTSLYPWELLVKYLQPSSFLNFVLRSTMRPLDSFLRIMVFPGIIQYKIKYTIHITLHAKMFNWAAYTYHVTVSCMNVLSLVWPLQTSHLTLPPPLHGGHLEKEKNVNDNSIERWPPARILRRAVWFPPPLKSWTSNWARLNAIDQNENLTIFSLFCVA
jgi:hypothetical protein